MFARSTTWRQGEGRTWQNATSIKKTFPSRASRLEQVGVHALVGYLLRESAF